MQVSTLVTFSASPGTLTFFTDSNCMVSAGNSVSFTSVSSNHTVYLRGTIVGSPRITVSSGSMRLSPASQVQQLVAGPAVSLAFVGTTGPVQALACVPLTLELRDAYTNLATLPAGTSGTVTLSSTPGVLRFHADTNCSGTGVGALSFAAGTSTLSLAVRPVTGVNQTLQAAMAGNLNDSHSLTVEPAVRRGTCVMSVSQSSTTCTISPAQRDLSKTLLVFQAISPQANEPPEAEVQCQLTSSSEVTCSRGSLPPGSPTTIVWQTLELPDGLTVQRGSNSLVCPSAAISLLTPVDATTSFNLSSVWGNGGNYRSDDMTSSRLSADGLSLFLEPPSAVNPCIGYEYQVASMAGVTVVRGVTSGFTSGGMGGRERLVVGLAAPSANAVLVSQTNLAGVPAPPGNTSMCH